MTRNEHIVIRSATAADGETLLALAVLDGTNPLPDGEILLAEADGRVRAALGANGGAISDPFWPSAELVHVLRVHAGLAKPKTTGRRRFALRRPVLA